MIDRATAGHEAGVSTAFVRTEDDGTRVVVHLEVVRAGELHDVSLRERSARQCELHDVE